MIPTSRIHKKWYLPISKNLAEKEHFNASLIEKKTMVTKIGAKEEEKRGVSREKATSDFVTSTLKQYRVILLVILANERPDCSNTRNVPPNHISNIGGKNSEVLRGKISLKDIIRNQCARSRHHTSIERRKQKTADSDKNQLSGSDKTAGMQILSNIRLSNHPKTTRIDFPEVTGKKMRKLQIIPKLNIEAGRTNNVNSDSKLRKLLKQSVETKMDEKKPSD